jgi:hypothetical protein
MMMIAAAPKSSSLAPLVSAAASSRVGTLHLGPAGGLVYFTAWLIEVEKLAKFWQLGASLGGCKVQ